MFLQHSRLHCSLNLNSKHPPKSQTKVRLQILVLMQTPFIKGWIYLREDSKLWKDWWLTLGQGQSNSKCCAATVQKQQENPVEYFGGFGVVVIFFFFCLACSLDRGKRHWTLVWVNNLLFCTEAFVSLMKFEFWDTQQMDSHNSFSILPWETPIPSLQTG